MSSLQARFEGPAGAEGSALLEAVAALGRFVDRDSRPEDVVSTVRGWAQRLCGRIAPDASALNRLRMLNHFFFDELGFHGEAGEEGAEAGYLHRVIERRAGIADSLSLLYMEIGRAIGLRLCGVSLAGSFLVKLDCNSGVVVIDVSERGCTLSVEQLRTKLAEGPQAAATRGGDATLQRCLRAVSEDDILLRILRGLGRRHRAAAQWEAALAVQSQLVERLPGSRRERLLRADLYERLECPRAAAADLELCLRQSPEAADAGELRRRFLRLQRRAGRLN
jgi:regulator of sirC expression with transglutaminase-like and TPR domain